MYKISQLRINITVVAGSCQDTLSKVKEKLCFGRLSPCKVDSLKTEISLKAQSSDREEKWVPPEAEREKMGQNN